jgi:hypothetical protein
MLEFDRTIFAALLSTALPKQSVSEDGEHSEYLQKQVFDVLRAKENIDLRKIDFGAFELCHVIPDGYMNRNMQSENGWLLRFNQYIKQTPPVSLKQRQFF